jgi:hypothetical protein
MPLVRARDKYFSCIPSLKGGVLAAGNVIMVVDDSPNIHPDIEEGGL